MSEPAVSPGALGVASTKNVLSLRDDPLRGLLEARHEHGDFVRFKLGSLPFYLVNDPSTIKQVLVDDADSYIKGPNYDSLRLVLGQSLSTSNGDAWRRKRDLIQPAFHRDAIDACVPKVVALCAERARAWTAHSEHAWLDVHEEMVSLAFRIAARGLLGFEGSQTEARISEVSVTLNRYLRARSRALIKLPIWLPTPANRAFQRAKRVLDDFACELIAERGRAADRQDDVVTWLIDAHSRGQSDMTELRDEIVNLLTAGMETANVLSFAWAALAQHPSAYRRLLDEVDSVLAGRAPTPEDLPNLVYTECVLSETMRLFPAVWLFARTATRNVEFGSRRVEAGALVGISPWSLHRHPSYWHKPEEFDPDRFAVDATAKRTRFSYLPFGAGGRACVGMKMAMMESKIVLAMLSQRHRLELVPSHPVEVEPSFMLRPRHGVRMSIHKR